MKMRIEFQERVPDITDAERDQFDRMGLPIKRKVGYRYRRAYFNLSDIFAPKEIPGVKEYCLLEFYDTSTVEVKGSYEDVCLQIDQREEQQLGEDD